MRLDCYDFAIRLLVAYPTVKGVLITHDNSIAVQADRIIRLEDGRVVYDGDAHAPEAVVQPTLLPETPDEEEKA